MEYEEISKAVYKDSALDKKKKNPTLAIILLLAGCAFIAGGYLTKTIPNVSFLCFAAGLILVIVGIIDLVMPSNDMVYKPTKETVKKNEMYIPEKDRTKMLDAIQAGDFTSLKQLGNDNSTSLKVVYYTVPSGKYLAMQAQEFVPYQYEPFEATTFFHDGERYEPTL